MKLRRRWASYLSVVILLLSTSFVFAAPVLMISIDGLKPEYVTHAEEHSQRIPTLRRFLTEGTYADGVLAVLPTVTYPDHTTLITGVWPAEHGILNNQLFDPMRTLEGAWYWYAGDIRVPTLWDAARTAHIGTASVSWPVSVNAPVDTLIPEYWRAGLTTAGAGSANPQDIEMMAALSRPDGMLFEMQKRIGPYMMGNEGTVEGGDRIRTRYSLDILERRKPGFMTIHLSSLDDTEHETGPFSEESWKTLEAIDGMVGQLIAAARKNDPKTVVVIVSDHGFAEVHHIFNIAIPFLEAGLIETKTVNGKVTVVSWKAQPWAVGGVAAIMLHDPSDTKTLAEVRAMLDKLASNPATGIDKIFDRAEIERMGGFPDAALLVALKPGYVLGSALSGPLFKEQYPLRGTHGYLASYPEMHASFFAMGEGVAKGRDLGTIDMRQIAPTVANLLGVSLPTAKQPKLKLAK